MGSFVEIFRSINNLRYSLILYVLEIILLDMHKHEELYQIKLNPTKRVLGFLSSISVLSM